MFRLIAGGVSSGFGGLSSTDAFGGTSDTSGIFDLTLATEGSGGKPLDAKEAVDVTQKPLNDLSAGFQGLQNSLNLPGSIGSLG
jgi:hypothetical protein